MKGTKLMHKFEVDVQGMNELFGARKGWRNVGELIQNIFDEDASKVHRGESQ